MALPRIVAICGRKRSGKDEIGKVLASLDYTTVKLAAPLKDALRALFGFNDEQTGGAQKEQKDARYDVSPREVMQFMGTEIMQYKINELLPRVGRRFLVNRLIEGIKTENNDKKFVITDMRFPHEELELRAHFPDILIIHVSRKSSDVCIDMHASESEHVAINATVHVTNDGTLDELKEQVLSRIYIP